MPTVLTTVLQMPWRQERVSGMRVQLGRQRGEPPHGSTPWVRTGHDHPFLCQVIWARYFTELISRRKGKSRLLAEIAECPQACGVWRRALSSAIPPGQRAATRFVIRYAQKYKGVSEGICSTNSRANLVENCKFSQYTYTLCPF